MRKKGNEMKREKNMERMSKMIAIQGIYAAT